MSTTADQLLDGVMAAAEEDSTNDTRIILSIDEPSRTINYDGDLILGVKGDRFAERIHFACPRYVYDCDGEVIDLSLDTTKIYIDYKNAYNEPYIKECKKHAIDDYGNYIFSWLISEYVTAKDGNVTFNVCVKDEPNSQLYKYEITQSYIENRFTKDANGSYGNSVQKCFAYMQYAGGYNSAITVLLTVEGDSTQYRYKNHSSTSEYWVYDPVNNQLHKRSTGMTNSMPSTIVYTTTTPTGQELREIFDDYYASVTVKEWHTTTFTGAILPAVDVSSKTPEVITSDTVTSAEIISEYDRLTNQLSDVNDYIDDQVNTQIGTVLDSYVINVTQTLNGSSYTYSTAYDFSEFDASNCEKYTCVIDRSSSGVNTDAILSITECTVNAPITMIIFSNGELSIQVQYNSDSGSTIIFEVNAIVPIALEVYQNSAELDGHDTDYPLLSTDTDEFMQDGDIIAAGVLRASNVTVNPYRGSIKAEEFIEDGKTLSDKYISKLKEYELRIDSEAQILEYSSMNKCILKHTFDTQAAITNITTVLPKARFIKIISPVNEQKVYEFAVKGYRKEYNAITNYMMNISGSMYYNTNFDEILINIKYKISPDGTYDNTLIMNVPYTLWEEDNSVLPTLYDELDEQYDKVIILYED